MIRGTSDEIESARKFFILTSPPPRERTVRSLWLAIRDVTKKIEDEYERYVVSHAFREVGKDAVRKVPRKVAIAADANAVAPSEGGQAQVADGDGRGPTTATDLDYTDADEEHGALFGVGAYVGVPKLVAKPTTRTGGGSMARLQSVLANLERALAEQRLRFEKAEKERAVAAAAYEEQRQRMLAESAAELAGLLVVHFLIFVVVFVHIDIVHGGGCWALEMIARIQMNFRETNFRKKSKSFGVCRQKL